jgi:hypothetical protein
MEKSTNTNLVSGLFIVQLYLFSAFSPAAPVNDPLIELKQKAFEILDTKCNVCHRKQNPFKVFSLRNMNKHAAKIYKQVFVKRRMPKGDEIILTEQEYQILKNWLKKSSELKNTF